MNDYELNRRELTGDEAVRLARESGMTWCDGRPWFQAGVGDLIRFARLVRAGWTPPPGVTVLDPLNDTQAELDAVSREMDVVYARWPKTKKEDDEHRVIREGLLAPLRARCVEIGQRRYRIAAGVAPSHQSKEKS